MKVAVTGATGFLGRYIVNHLLRSGDFCRCWFRPESDRGGFEEGSDSRIEWLPGELADDRSAKELVDGVDAVVHAALYRPGAGFRGAEGNINEFVAKNIGGSIQLIQAAVDAGVERFVFISTCAVHEQILDDRPLDEAHPLRPFSHYGAHKAAIEKFMHSYGLGHNYNICSLRPTGIYGAARPIENSKWYRLVQAVRAGEPVRSERGGKEVHAADVAAAVGILLDADGTAGQAYNCYDLYISEQEVATIARDLTGSSSEIAEINKGPKNQISTEKLRALGMSFGGRERLKETIRELVEA